MLLECSSFFFSFFFLLGVVFVIEAAGWTRESVSVAELKSNGWTVLAVRASQR